MPTEQERFLGHHPIAPHIYGIWLTNQYMPTSATKKHRSLNENFSSRNEAIDEIANWIVRYHLHPHAKRCIDKQRLILDRHGLADFVDNLHILPVEDVTRKGNLGEILLIEYLKESKGYTTFVDKLTYNPNVDQSMKGDDVLMFNQTDLEKEVLYGESKFRGVPSKQVLDEMVTNLQEQKRLPISMEFVANRLAELGEADLADAITELHMKILKEIVPVTNIGFLISSKSTTPSKDTFSTVERHLSTTNPRLVVLSLGIDNPQQIVDEAYVRADAILKSK